jgi:diadenosine tetraphosphatase ApaH/serine/threonine PP2A family protein phosphatase
LFNPVARYAAEWTLKTLTAGNREYLRELASGPREIDGFVMVHGSLLDEDEYLVDAPDAAFQFPEIEGRLAFFGHTHVQGGFLLWDSTMPSASPLSVQGGEVIRVLEGRSQLLNPGSVGQPRDSDWRAAYAIYDSGQQLVEFRRCPYDLESAQRKIREAGLPPVLADRLALGR